MHPRSRGCSRLALTVAVLVAYACAPSTPSGSADPTEAGAGGATPPLDAGGTGPAGSDAAPDAPPTPSGGPCVFDDPASTFGGSCTFGP